MALVENLVVALGLKSSGFSSGIKKAEKDLGGFSKYVSGIKTALSGFGSRLVGIAAAYLTVRTAIDSFSSAMKSLEDLDDASQRIGINASSLRKLQYAAVQSGVEIEGLNAALNKMLVNLSKDASSEGASAFSQLGLDAKKLKSLSPDKQFIAIAGALSKVKNAADRAAIATAIFGKSGPTLLPMFAGVSDLAIEAEKLGLIFSDLDVAKVAAAGDEWTKVKEAIKASWQAIAIEMAPAIGILSRYMVKLILEVREFGSAYGGMATFVVSATGRMVDAVVALTTVMRLQRNVIAAFVSLAGALFPGQSTGAIEQAKEYMKNFEKALEDYQKAIKGGFHDEMMKGLEDLKKEWEALKAGEAEFEIGGGSEKLMPGAFEKGTKEAAVEAAKAGGQDRAVEYAKMSVEKLASLDERAKKMETSMLAISNVLGLNAGIA